MVKPADRKSKRVRVHAQFSALRFLRFDLCNPGQVLMPFSAEAHAERRRAKAPPFPRPRGRGPPGWKWDAQVGGWWRADRSKAELDDKIDAIKLHGRASRRTQAVRAAQRAGAWARSSLRPEP